jgi:Double zinc ribbon
MVDITLREDAAGYETLEISRRALRALSGIEGLQGGPLSPLARMQSPVGAADTSALVAAWEALDDTWKWAVPALLDPRRTIALVMGDGNTNVIGQYLFPDAEAYGPGFNVNVGKETVTLTGPTSLDLLHVGLYSGLALEDVPELEPFRVDLAADYFWVLMACLDAYRAVALALRLQRAGGTPRGVGPAGLARIWADGISSFNPGWAVSLFSLLVPDQVPRDLPERLPRLLQEMARKGHLQEVADSGGTLYAPPESLSPLLWGPTMSFSFGLVTQRLVEPQTAESTVLGGWRTPGGVWLADLSDMNNSGVSLALIGPALAEEIIDEILGDDSLAPPWEEFVMDTPYTRDAMVSSLRAIPAEAVPGMAAEEGAPEEIAPTPERFCTACGNPLGEGLAFCNKCGKAVGGTRGGPVTCTACGNPLGEGLAFCNKCGKRV